MSKKNCKIQKIFSRHDNMPSLKTATLFILNVFLANHKNRHHQIDYLL
jgi:hypothetical protein